MKSLDELAAIRNKTLDSVELRSKDAGRKEIIVGMGTIGIAAGARDVLRALVDEVSRRDLDDVVVLQTADAKERGLEPVVEVVLPGKERITYARVAPDMVPRIVTESLENGNVVSEYTADHHKKNSAE